MKNVVVEVGARGIRSVVPSPMSELVEDSPLSAQLLDQALNGEGELFRHTGRGQNEWIVVRNIPALLNNNQEIMREATRVEIKFADGLYLLRNDDPDRELKLKKLKSLPSYGTLIRPMAEITRENKAKAQSEAIKTLSTLADGEGLRELLLKLEPKLEQMGVVRTTLDSLMATFKPAEIPVN